MRMVVHAKGFAEQTRTIDTKSGAERGKHGVPNAANYGRQGMNVRRRICGLAMVLSLFAAVGVAQDKSTKLSSARSAALLWTGPIALFPAAWFF